MVPEMGCEREQHGSSQLTALIEQIPSVQACRIWEEDGLPREIHILADDARGPKQIARDVQSALMARFGLYVDHRMISIAQIPCAFSKEPAPAPGGARLVCARLALAQDKREIEMTVTLSLGDREEAATERGRLAPQERRGVAARAAAASISRFLPEGESVRLKDVGEVYAAGRPVILAVVSLDTAEGAQELVGAAFEREDGDMSVVRAVLDAVNRRLRLPSA